MQRHTQLSGAVLFTIVALCCCYVLCFYVLLLALLRSVADPLCEKAGDPCSGVRGALMLRLGSSAVAAAPAYDGPMPEIFSGPFFTDRKSARLAAAVQCSPAHVCFAAACCLSCG
jgi:hypothetical protein